MSKLKDKLSANMRAVKANQHPDKSHAAPTKAAPAPVAHKPAAPVVKKKSEVANSGNATPENTGSILFPTRVWPD